MISERVRGVAKLLWPNSLAPFEHLRQGTFFTQIRWTISPQTTTGATEHNVKESSQTVDISNYMYLCKQSASESKKGGLPFISIEHASYPLLYRNRKQAVISKLSCSLELFVIIRQIIGDNDYEIN